MSLLTSRHIQQQSALIRHILRSRSRPVQEGCLIKIPLQTIFGPELFSDPLQHIYGVVGNIIYQCPYSSARSFNVTFCLDGIDLSSRFFHVLTMPVFENQMYILRFPEQNASLDDTNIDDLFHRVDGKWTSRSSNTVN